MSPRNSIQVSEANALFCISSTVMEPFGYTGMPVLMYADLDELIDRELRELVSRSNTGIIFPTHITCYMLIAKARHLGATSAEAEYKPNKDVFEMQSETGSLRKVWTPSHYVVDYEVAGRSFSSYIDSAI